MYFLCGDIILITFFKGEQIIHVKLHSRCPVLFIYSWRNAPEVVWQLYSGAHIFFYLDDGEFRRGDILRVHNYMIMDNINVGDGLVGGTGVDSVVIEGDIMVLCIVPCHKTFLTVLHKYFM